MPPTDAHGPRGPLEWRAEKWVVGAAAPRKRKNQMAVAAKGDKRMRSCATTSLCGMLLATGLASGASAMDQNTASASALPIFSLPAFLDISRAPALQDAWRSRFGAPSGLTSAAPTRSSDGMLSEDAAIIAGQQALTRAEAVSREAEVVRARAEELSRRFASDEPAARDTAIVAAAAVADESAAAIEPAVATAETAGSETAAVGAEDAAAEEVTAEAPAEPVAQPGPAIEDMGRHSARAAPRPTKRVVAAEQTVGEPASNFIFKSSALAQAPDGTPGSNVSPNAMIPGELRSFGWNSQP